MKQMFMKWIITALEGRARQLLAKFHPKIVVVTGSVGKTSTKLGIATVLSEKYRVMAHYGSYNTPIAIPLAMFNMHLPKQLRNPFAWWQVWQQMGRQLREEFPYDVLVLELGSDHPGEVEYFRKYLSPDIAVVTAVTPEHMEGFGTLDAVAQEELSVAKFAKLTMINRDDIDGSFSKYIPQGIEIDTYGTSGVAEYRYIIADNIPGEGFNGTFVSPELGQLPVTLQVLGEHNVRTAVGAGAVGLKMGLTPQQIQKGMQAIRPVHGRMNLLRGLQGSQLIDDTYNSSPAAAVAALQTLYLFPAKQRIAILGSMNELGDYSKTAHEQVGQMCDAGLLDWVVTIGIEAEKYLAPAASGKGCQVRSFASPYQAGTFVHSVLAKDGAVVLAKGSQNGVFAEEALKVLVEAEDEPQLVRQTSDWMAIKEKQFGSAK